MPLVASLKGWLQRQLTNHTVCSFIWHFYLRSPTNNILTSLRILSSVGQLDKPGLMLHLCPYLDEGYSLEAQWLASPATIAWVVADSVQSLRRNCIQNALGYSLTLTEYIRHIQQTCHNLRPLTLPTRCSSHKLDWQSAASQPSALATPLRCSWLQRSYLTIKRSSSTISKAAVCKQNKQTTETKRHLYS